MKKLMIATMLGLMIASATFETRIKAQVPEGSCTEQSVRTITLRGLRLGMTADEVFVLVPRANRVEESKAAINAPPRYSNYGVVGAGFQAEELDASPSASKWHGVNRVGLTFFDGRLVGFSVIYAGFEQGGAKWNGVDEFLLRLAEPLRLPSPVYWDTSGDSKRLKCGQIQLEVSGNGGGTFSTFDYAHQAETRRRYQEELAARRRAFKP